MEVKWEAELQDGKGPEEEGDTSKGRARRVGSNPPPACSVEDKEGVWWCWQAAWAICVVRPPGALESLNPNPHSATSQLCDPGGGSGSLSREGQIIGDSSWGPHSDEGDRTSQMRLPSRPRGLSWQPWRDTAGHSASDQPCLTAETWYLGSAQPGTRCRAPSGGPWALGLE